MNVPVCERVFNKRKRYFIYYIVGILPDLFMPLWIPLFIRVHFFKKILSFSALSRTFAYEFMNRYFLFSLPLSIFYASAFALNSVDFYVRHVFFTPYVYKLWMLQQSKQIYAHNKNTRGRLFSCKYVKLSTHSHMELLFMYLLIKLSLIYQTASKNN